MLRLASIDLCHPIFCRRHCLALHHLAWWVIHLPPQMSAFSNWAPTSLAAQWAPVDADMSDEEPPLALTTPPAAEPVPAQPAVVLLDPEAEGRDPNVPEDTMAAMLARSASTWSQFLFLRNFITIKTLLHEGVELSSQLARTVQRLGGHFLCSKKALHVNKAALGEILHVNPNTIEPCLTTLGDCLFHADRQQRHSLEQVLSQSGLTPLMYMDISKYDETPLKLQQQQMLEAILPSVEAQKASGLAGQFQTKAATVAKLLATEHRFLMLLKAEQSIGSEGGSQYLLFAGTTLTALQVLERATGGVLLRALLANNAVSEFSQNYKVQCRCTTTDKYAANAVAERKLAELRGGSWVHTHHSCVVHVIATCIGRTMDFYSEDISGLVHFSLSLGVGSAMDRFRKSLIAVVQARLVILPGAASPEAAKYKQSVLDLFCTSGTKTSLRRFLLEALPNGDWRNREQVEVFLAPGIAISRDQVVQRVAAGLVLALCGKLFSTYPQHRWLGSEISVSEVGLLEAVHGLASASYDHMLQQWTHSGSRAAATQPLRAQSDARMLLQAETAGTANIPSGTLPAGQEAEQHHPQPAVADASQGASHAENTGTFQVPVDHAAVNEQHRRRASEWLRTRPLSSLVVCKLVLTPLTDLISTYIHRAGQAWEAEDRAQVASAQSLQQVSHKTSPMLEHVKLTAENKFFQDLGRLREDQAWLVMPLEAHTLEVQSTVFQALSRAGCALHELVVKPAQRCPLALLRLLVHGESVLPNILALPDCMLDDFSKQHLTLFPGDKLLSADSLAILDAYHLGASPDIVSVEWGHGRVHRLIKKSSVQTVAPTVSFVSSQWLMQKHHLRYQVPLLGQGQPVKAEAQHMVEDPDVPEEPMAKKRRGGGGAFRAFISVRSRGQSGKADMKHLANEYARAKAEHTREYQEALVLGEAGTARHKVTGQPSFGPATRDVILSKRKHQRASLSNLPGSSSLVLGSTVTLDPDTPDQQVLLDDTAEQLSKIRRGDLLAKKEKQKKREELMRSLVATCNLLKDQNLEELFTRIPDLLPLGPTLHFAPHHRFLSFDVVHNIEKEAIDVAAFAAQKSRTCNLQAAVQRDWKSRHSTIMEDPEQETTAEPTKKTLCFEYGCCVCRDAGAPVFAMRNRFLRYLKEHFPRRSPEHRKLLQDGFIVVQLIQDKPTPTAMSTWGEGLLAALDEEDTSEAQDVSWAKQDHVWLHIGLHYWSPYRPTFQVLRFAERHASTGNVWLEQTGIFLSEFELWNTLDRQSKWTGSLHRLHVSSMPVAHLEPRLCLIKPLGLEAVLLWPLPKRGRPLGAKGRKGRRPASAAAIPPTVEGSQKEVAAEAEHELGEAETGSEGGEQEQDEAEVDEDEDRTGVSPTLGAFATTTRTSAKCHCHCSGARTGG